MQKTTKCLFFIPGLSETYRSGGLMVIKDTAELIGKIPSFEVEFVTTHEENPETLTPQEVFDEIKRNPDLVRKTLFFVTWGPLVEKHIKLIRKNCGLKVKIIYYAQSYGWKIKIPKDVSIACVSRFVMAQWTLNSPENFIFYIPPPLSECFEPTDSVRDIDILVHTRKQNNYCLNKLLPALEKENVSFKKIDDWIPQEQFANYLNRTKIFLYITNFHKAGFARRFAEGFGLPALEALACGAMVGSNLLGGVTDFLTPGENCIKLQNADVRFDIAQILTALKNFKTNKQAADEVSLKYRPEAVLEKWRYVIASSQ